MSIYPKAFALGKRRVRPSTSFVIMPFKQELSYAFGLIKEFLNRLDIQCIRGDDIFSEEPILNTILDQILSAEFIIADLTTRSANVFYEVGMAHAFRDAENVILIAQSIDDVPFDIRHLPVIIYDTNNKFIFEEGLKQRIASARKQIGQKRFLLDYFSDSEFSYSLVERAIDIIRKENKDFISSLHILLSDRDQFSGQKINLSEIKQIILELDSFSTFADGGTKKLLYRVKLDIVCNVSGHRSFDNYVLSFLSKFRRNVHDSSVRQDLSFSVDLACRLIKEGWHKPQAVSWLLGYLENSRVGGIDITRNKVDEFLVTTQDSDVNIGLRSLLKHPNFTLREASIDILTQKLESNTYNQIISNIDKEQNIYVVRSMINGLARYDNPSAAMTVSRWFDNNKDILKKQRALFLIDVAIEYFKKFEFYHLAEKIVRLKSEIF